MVVLLVVQEDAGGREEHGRKLSQVTLLLVLPMLGIVFALLIFYEYAWPAISDWLWPDKTPGTYDFDVAAADLGDGEGYPGG